MTAFPACRPSLTLFVLTTIIVTFAAVVVSSARVAAPAPAPIPAPAERAAAEKLIRELFAADLARRRPADQAATATRFLAEAEKEREDEAARYVLLDEARNLAVAAGDAALAWRAIDAMAAAYQVDGAALRSDVLAALAKSVSLTPKSAVAAAGHALAAADAFCEADDYVAAQKAAAQAETLAIRSRDAGVLASTKARVAAVRSMAVQYERARAALEKLKAAPDDGDANLAAGSFYCFAKGDWAAGLPLLAKSSDPALQALAAADLAAPKTADARKALADRWWDAAEAKTAPAAFKPQMRHRAAAWYERAAGGLTGLAQAVARKRIAEAEAGGAAVGRPVAVDLLALVDPKRDAVKGAWAVDNGTLIGRGGETVRLRIPYQPGEEYDLRVTYTYTTGSEGMMLMLPTARGQVMLVTNPGRLYFEDVAGQFGAVPHDPIKRGEPRTVTVRVRKARVDVLVNDKPVTGFDPAARQMGLQSVWRLGDDRSAGVGNWNTTIVFSKVELTPAAGAGARVP